MLNLKYVIYRFIELNTQIKGNFYLKSGKVEIWEDTLYSFDSPIAWGISTELPHLKIIVLNNKAVNETKSKNKTRKTHIKLIKEAAKYYGAVVLETTNWDVFSPLLKLQNEVINMAFNLFEKENPQPGEDIHILKNICEFGEICRVLGYSDLILDANDYYFSTISRYIANKNKQILKGKDDKNYVIKIRLNSDGTENLKIESELNFTEPVDEEVIKTASVLFLGEAYE